MLIVPSLNTTTSLSSLVYTQASTNSLLTNSYYSQVSTNSISSSSYYNQASTNSILSSSYYNQTSTNSIISTSYYNQTSTNSLLSSKQNFISDNSNLSLNVLTTQTTLTCQGFKVMNNSNQDALIFPGGNGLTTGGICTGNLGTYPLVLRGTINNATILQNLASTWTTLNATVPQQSLLNGVLYYGLSPSNLVSNSQASHYLTINGTKCVHVDSIVAFLVGMNKCMYNQLKAAGISGFV